MSDEMRACKKGHKMNSKIGKDGWRHYFCQKCRNAAARARRAARGSSGRRGRTAAAMSLVFSSDTLWAVNRMALTPTSLQSSQRERGQEQEAE